MYYNPPATTSDLTPVLNPQQIIQSILLTLVPQKLTLNIVDPGTGSTPTKGQFIRVKQFIHLSDMSLVYKARTNLLFGRNKLIPGLDHCLALTRQGFRGRLTMSKEYGYDRGSLAGMGLVIDVQVLTISNEPVLGGQQDEAMLLNEIGALDMQGDDMVRRGDLKTAQIVLMQAFDRIQSQLAGQIKSYLRDSVQVQAMLKRQQITLQKIQKDKKQLVCIYKMFDSIRLKGIQVALLNQDYYRVLSMSKLCTMQTRLADNPRILIARGRALGQVGQFRQSLKIMQQLCDLFPEESLYIDEMERIKRRKDEADRQTRGVLYSEPVMAYGLQNRVNEKQKKKWFGKKESIEDIEKESIEDIDKKSIEDIDKKSIEDIEKEKQKKQQKNKQKYKDMQIEYEKEQEEDASNIESNSQQQKIERRLSQDSFLDL